MVAVSVGVVDIVVLCSGVVVGSGMVMAAQLLLPSRLRSWSIEPYTELG